MKEPWDDWIPGVLSDKQVRTLFDSGKITPSRNPSIDYSSFDLSISREGYRLVKGSVKPFGINYLHQIEAANLVESLEPDADGTFTLQARQTYLFKVREEIPFLGGSSIHGQATAKSSVGRVDVLARLIVDGMDCYEAFSPEQLAVGNKRMYLEITPMTFPVRVKEGIYISQLRLFYGKPEHAEVSGPELHRSLLHHDTEEKEADGSLSVDLSPTSQSGEQVSAFCAHHDEAVSTPANPIDLWTEEGRPLADPCSSWTFKRAEDRLQRLQIRKNEFYIMRSKERIALPGGIAVYCRANDETIGEMRIHYAGFVHPFFGRMRDDEEIGTPLIFEVRGHDVDVNLRDGEKMARLTFYRMSQDCEKKSNVGNTPYQNQTLKLSSFFDKWPEKVSVASDGKVSRKP
jgi:dCTP deaminase